MFYIKIKSYLPLYEINLHNNNIKNCIKNPLLSHSEFYELLNRFEMGMDAMDNETLNIH